MNGGDVTLPVRSLDGRATRCGQCVRVRHESCDPLPPDEFGWGCWCFICHGREIRDAAEKAYQNGREASQLVPAFGALIMLMRQRWRPWDRQYQRVTCHQCGTLVALRARPVLQPVAGCAQCGKPVYGARRGVTRRYCSSACSQKAYRARKRAERPQDAAEPARVF